MRPSRRWVLRRALGVASMLAVLAAPASAWALTVSPVQVDVTPARRVVTITLTNEDARAYSFQVTVRAWTLVDGTDRFSDSDDLLVVPPIADIPAGGKQVFRVTTRKPFDDERSYRLVFEDVTELAAPQPEGITLRISHDLPVFVSPAGKLAAKPVLQACDPPAPTGEGCVRLVNEGERRLEVRSLAIVSDNGTQPVSSRVRVLAGGWRQWLFPVPTGGVPIRIVADTADGPISADWPLPAR